MESTDTRDVVWQPLAKEVAYIQDDLLRGFVQNCLKSAPAYFWTVPASTSGKYHPPCSRVQGGLVHHTRMVVYFVREYVRAMQLEAWHDELVAAAIMHDIYKNGDNPNDRSKGFAHWSAHGAHAKEYLEKQVLDGPVETHFSTNPQFCARVNKVFDLMSRHMHIWGGDAPRCQSMEDYALYIADYTASRTLVNITKFEGEL